MKNSVVIFSLIECTKSQGLEFNHRLSSINFGFRFLLDSGLNELVIYISHHEFSSISGVNFFV